MVCGNSCTSSFSTIHRKDSPYTWMSSSSGSPPYGLLLVLIPILLFWYFGSEAKRLERRRLKFKLRLSKDGASTPAPWLAAEKTGNAPGDADDGGMRRKIADARAVCIHSICTNRALLLTSTGAIRKLAEEASWRFEEAAEEGA